MSPVEIAAHAVAQAERALSEAEKRHQIASDHAELVRSRVVETEARRQNVRVKQTAGELDDRAAGALLAAVGEDLADLRTMLDEALHGVETTRPVREQNALDEARAALERAELQAQFEALRGHVGEIEDVMLGALARLHDLGTHLGKPRTLTAHYTFSSPMTRAVQFGEPPARHPR
jgi:hypothetical protein